MTPLELQTKLTAVANKMATAKTNLTAFKTNYDKAKADFTLISNTINSNEVTLLLSDLESIITALA